MTDFTKSEALRYLSRDPLLYADMIECLNRGRAQEVTVMVDGVYLWVPGGLSYVAADSEKTTLELALPSIMAGRTVVAHGDIPISAGRGAGLLEINPPCLQFVWQGPAPDTSGPAEIRPLGPEALPIVVENYHDLEPESYIRERLGSGELFGAYLDGALAGFIGLHFEGSVGMLFVMPPYRRQGIGGQLERCLISREVSLGHTPYCHVLETNAASIAMARALGWTPASGRLLWFYPRPQDC